MNEKLLYQKIYTCLKDEDQELTSLENNGIFYAPELYVAFIMGKEIKKNDKAIFGTSAKWIREIDLKNGGPTDIVFKTEDLTYVFEIKLRDTYHAYNSDVIKLKKLDDRKYVKYFVALIDAWEKDRENDPRVTELEKLHPDLSRISKIESFKSNQDRYVGDICCALGIWKVAGN